MSYTVVVDERVREQRLENRLNQVVRHCKIGRVKHKMQVHGGAFVPIGPWEEFPPRLPAVPLISTPNTARPALPVWLQGAFA